MPFKVLAEVSSQLVAKIEHICRKTNSSCVLARGPAASFADSTRQRAAQTTGTTRSLQNQGLSATDLFGRWPPQQPIREGWRGFGTVQVPGDTDWCNQVKPPKVELEELVVCKESQYFCPLLPLVPGGSRWFQVVPGGSRSTSPHHVTNLSTSNRL